MDLMAAALNSKEEVSEMSSTASIVAVVDLKGRVVGAQLAETPKQSGTTDYPAAGILPAEGQREVRINVPREILELPGPDLQRFLNHVKVHWPAEVELPEMEISNKRKG